MSDEILNNFENQINALVDRYEALKQDNVRLRNKQSDLMVENANINKKYSLVVDSIKKMVGRLKEVGNEDGSR